MKRFAMILTAVAALTVFVTPSAKASDSFYSHGASYGYASHGYVAPPVFGHGYVAPAYGHGYVAPLRGGHGYVRSYRHGGGLRISTPRFGLRFGH